MRILIIEDNERLANTLSDILSKNSYTADIAPNGVVGIEMIETAIYDLVILDLMLPEVNGYQVLQCVRSKKINVPIVVLSAKSEVDDKVDAFLKGADDYITKPFDTRELLVRIHAIIQRRGNKEIVDKTVGNIALDVANSAISNIVTGASITMPKREFQILEMFFYNQNQILEKEQIATKIWGFDSKTEYNNVEVYISFVRRKLSFLNANISIVAVRGRGYRLEINDD